MEPPKQKTENIITDADFLPYENCHIGFYFEKDSNDFHLYHLLKSDIKLPILLLEKRINYNLKDRRFSRNEEGLVQLEEIEAFINF